LYIILSYICVQNLNNFCIFAKRYEFSY